MGLSLGTQKSYGVKPYAEMNPYHGN